MSLELLTPTDLLHLKTSRHPIKPQLNLSLRMGYDPKQHHSCVTRQYATYPYRLSRELRLDETNHRAYVYIMNTSPGLLAGDDFSIAIALDAQTRLHLTDQAATKVHCMPDTGSLAQLRCQISIGDGASLEYVPEPLILYEDSTLEQTTEITLASTGQLFISDIILPGRLAQAEYYVFRSYQNCLQVKAVDGELLFKDSMRLQGRENPFTQSALLSELPIMASIITVIPEIALTDLMQRLQAFKRGDRPIRSGYSVLPQGNGLLIRAIADQSSTLKRYIRYCLNCVRQLTNQPNVPDLPK